MSDTIMVALISGAVSLVVNFGSKWMDNRNGIAKDIKDIKADVGSLKENDRKNGDMIYTMLSHMATGNESGEMKRALNEYNEYFRHS